MQTVCNFCLKTTDAYARANDVAICPPCMIANYNSLAAKEPLWFGVMLLRIVQECPPKDGDLLAEPMAHAIVRFFNGNLGPLQKGGEAMAARDTTPFWRAATIFYAAIHPALMTALDARRAIYAALFTGELSRAGTIEPARTAEKADRCLRCHQALVRLLHADPSSTTAKTLRDQVVELCKAAPASDVERMIFGVTEAFAHVRAGDAAKGLAVYKPFRDEPELRPWHLLAIGDALSQTGDDAGARTMWSRVADKTAWEPYWPSRARERLSGSTPYR